MPTTRQRHDGDQEAAIKLWQHEQRHGKASPALRATIRRHTAIDLWRKERPTLPLPETVPNREQPSLLEGIVGVCGVTPADLQPTKPAQARLTEIHERYPDAVETFLQAAILVESGQNLPDALKQRLTRYRRATGLALSLRGL